MIAQLRMLLAEKFLSWAASISPKNDDGTLLVKYVNAYVKETLRRSRS